MAYNVLVQVAKSTTNLPAGVAFGQTNVRATDSAGLSQDFVLNGSEATPWSVVVTVAADGPSSFAVQDVDSTGANLGTALTASFTPGPVPTFEASTGLSVTAA